MDVTASLHKEAEQNEQLKCKNSVLELLIKDLNKQLQLRNEAKPLEDYFILSTALQLSQQQQKNQVLAQHLPVACLIV